MMKQLKKLLKSPKGAMIGIQDLQGIAIALVFIVVVIVVGSNILDGFQDTQTSGSVAYNTTTTGLTAMSNLTSQLPLIATTAGLLVVLGFVLMVFGGRNRV